jgi:hypothetical protein
VDFWDRGEIFGTEISRRRDFIGRENFQLLGMSFLGATSSSFLLVNASLRTKLSH